MVKSFLYFHVLMSISRLNLANSLSFNALYRCISDNIKEFLCYKYAVYLPFTPTRTESLLRLAWFTHSDPAVVRAGFFLREAAWRSDIPGSLSVEMSSLALHARLSVQQMQENYACLMDGWAIDGVLAVNEEIRALAASAQERFGDELAVMAEAATVAMQGGTQEFDLFSPAQIKQRKGGKIALKDFSPDADSLQAMALQGYTTTAQQEWVVKRFIDYAKTKNERRTLAQWQASFRNYVGSSYTQRDFRASPVFASGLTLASVDGAAPLTGRDLLRQAMGGRSTFQQAVQDANQKTALSALHRARSNVPFASDGHESHEAAPAPTM